jgi:hypothetical protein
MVSGPIRPRATAHGAWRPDTRDRLKGWLGLGLAARSDGEAAHGAEQGVRRERSRRGHRAQLVCVTTRWHPQCAAGRWHDAAGELVGATGRAPGKAVGGGAHPSGDAAWRRLRMLQPVAFNGSEVAR